MKVAPRRRPATEPALAIVIVNHNSGPRLQRCILNLLEDPPETSWHAIVIDNGSTDGSADFLVHRPPEAVELVRQGNEGFTRAINFGFQRTAGRMILILNPDMVPLPGSIGAMVQHLEEDATLGAVGGYCIDPEGRFEHRYAHTLPTPRTAYLETFGGRGKVRNRAYRRHALLDADFSKPVEVPQPAGGCLMLRRSVFANALADERFGIYWSDVSIARQVHDAGFRAKVFPDAVFLHDHAATAPNPAVGAKLKTDYYVGAIRYFRIHGSAGQARLAKLLFAWGIGVSTIRAIAEVLLRLHPRQHLRRQVRVLADFLRDRSPFADRQ